MFTISEPLASDEILDVPLPGRAVIDFPHLWWWKSRTEQSETNDIRFDVGRGVTLREIIKIGEAFYDELASEGEARHYYVENFGAEPRVNEDGSGFIHIVFYLGT